MKTRQIAFLLLAANAAANSADSDSYRVRLISENGKSKTVLSKTGLEFEMTPTTIISDNGKHVFDPCSSEHFRLPGSNIFHYNDGRQIFKPKGGQFLKAGRYTLPVGEQAVFSAMCPGSTLKILKPVSFTLKADTSADDFVLTSKGRMINRVTGALVFKLRPDEFTHIPNGTFEVQPKMTLSPSR